MKKTILLLLLFLSGCVSNLIYDKSKIFVHSDVSLDAINVISHQREHDKQIFIQVNGISSSNQTVYYKTDWYDVNGMKITTALSQWKIANLSKGLDFVWTIPAPTTSAVSYKVYITKNIGNGIIQ